uniref:Uncharacterized protein n=1 Tax=Ignisphaera aggregans TaxID=334771 RepID=A0A7C4GYT9_9CREN
MMKTVSEFVAILVMITISLVSVFLFTTFFSNFIYLFAPKPRYLKVSVSSIEVLYSGPPISVGSTNFTASYIYKANIVLHNYGTDNIINLWYSVYSLDPSLISIGTNDTADVYDPIILANTGLHRLPDSLNQNEAKVISLVIMSKKDLANNNVLILTVRGIYSNNEKQEVQVSIFE